MTPTSHDDQPLASEASYLTSAEVAEFLRTTPGTVRYWRHIGYGPLGVKVGRHVLYSKVDVDAWIAKRRAEAEEQGRADR